MRFVLGLRCTICGAVYAVDDVSYVCPRHGDDGILDVMYDYDALRQHVSPASIARHFLANGKQQIAIAPLAIG